MTQSPQYRRVNHHREERRERKYRLRGGWSVDLAHPDFVNRMKQNPDKTDFSDARMLADLTRVGYLPRV